MFVYEQCIRSSAIIVETAGTCLVLLPVGIYFILNIMSDYPAED